MKSQDDEWAHAQQSETQPPMAAKSMGDRIGPFWGVNLTQSCPACLHLKQDRTDRPQACCKARGPVVEQKWARAGQVSQEKGDKPRDEGSKPTLSSTQWSPLSSQAQPLRLPGCPPMRMRDGMGRT